MTAAQTSTGTVAGTARPPATDLDARALSLLGALGIVLVLYSYLIALWPGRRGETPQAVLLLRQWVNEPLGIGSDFGFFGMALLLLISGYLIARWLDEESAGRTAVRVLVTFFPLAIVTGAVVFVLLSAGGEVYTIPARAEPAGGDVLSAALLLAPITASVQAVAFAGILSAVLLFLLIATACLPLARFHPAWAVLAQLVPASIPVFLGAGAEGPLRGLGLLAAFLPVVIIGQVAWLVRSGSTPLWLGVLLGMTTFQVMSWAEHAYQELVPWWYALGTVFAVLLFLLLLAHPPRFGLHPVLVWLFDRRFTLLLFTPTIGWAASSALPKDVPAVVAIVTGLLATSASADVYHRLVETNIRGFVGRGESTAGS